MFFRFAVAIIAIVLISLIGIAIEKRNLELRREISRQHYQMEGMLEIHARLRQETQQLGATERIMEAAQQDEQSLVHPQVSSGKREKLPLMRWQRPSAQ